MNNALSKFQPRQEVIFLSKLKWKDKSWKCLQHDIALRFQSVLLGLGKLLIQVLSSRTRCLLCCVILLCIHVHPHFLPSLCFGPLFIPPILFPLSLLSFLLIYMLHFLIIHSSSFINLHSQRIYNPLSQHCLYFFIFFQIIIFPLTMQQSVKHT